MSSSARLLSRIKSKIFTQPKFEPEPYPSPASYQEQLKRREAWFDWLMERDFELFLTLTVLGVEVGEKRIHGLTWLLKQKLDGYWIGRDWRSTPAELQTQIWGVVEKGPKSGHSHLHALLNRPRKIREAEPSWKDHPRILSRVFTSCMQTATGLPVDILFQAVQEGQVEQVAYLLKECFGDPHFVLYGS